MNGPLEDIRVIDLTQVLSGPFCSMVLADMGADVIKVEPPGGDVARRWGPHPDSGTNESTDSYGGYFASVNRNKRSVVLDLHTPEGVEGLHRLLSTADVLLENYRVGVMERLGFSYESLHERYPSLVYASIRGFGDPRTGASPYADWPAFDIIAQAMGGILGITGSDSENPVKVGPGVGDIFPAVLAATGILAAIHEVDRTGKGQLVDVAMYDAVLSLTERIVYQHSITGMSPRPQGNTHPLLCPYGLVRTADGFVAIATPTDHHWRALCDVMKREDLKSHSDFETNEQRIAHAPEVYRIVEEWSTTKTSHEAVTALTGSVPCAPVHSAADIARDPHVAARQMIRSVDHPSGASISIAGSPIKFSGHEEHEFVRAPLLGEHTSQVLDEL